LIDIQPCDSGLADAPHAVVTSPVLLVVVAIAHDVESRHSEVVGHRPDTGRSVIVDDLDLRRMPMVL
jgi:hypothetical protein